jgi:hypothetical protein
MASRAKEEYNRPSNYMHIWLCGAWSILQKAIINFILSFYSNYFKSNNPIKLNPPNLGKL